MQNGNKGKINLSSAVKFAFAMLLAVAMFFGGMFVLNNKISQKRATVQIDSDTTATVDDNVDADTTDRNYVGSYYQFKEVAEVGSNVDGWSVPKGTASCFSNFGTNLGEGKTSWSVPKGTASCFSNFGTNLGEGKTSFKLHGARKKWVTVWHRVNVGDYYNGKSIRFTCDYSFSTTPSNGGVRFGLYSSAPSNGDPGDGLASTRMSGTSGTAQFTYKMNTSDTYYLALGFGDMPNDTDVNVTLSNLTSGIAVKNIKGEDSTLIIDGTMTTYGQLAPVKLGDTNSAKIIRGVRVNGLIPYHEYQFYSYNSSSTRVNTYGYLYDTDGGKYVAENDDDNGNDSSFQPLIKYSHHNTSYSSIPLIFGVGPNPYSSIGTMASGQIYAYARGYEAQVGSTKYTMLENAIKKASAGSTVEIIASSLDTVSNDISKTLTITSTQSTTITWDTTRQISSAMFNISGSATVTFGGSNTITLGGGSKNYQRAINISSTNATCNLSSVTIQYFKNTSLNGGAIYSEGTLNLSGKAKIDGNSAINGGGVCLAGGSSMRMTGGMISNNTASTNGGGVYVVDGGAEMTGGTISGNTAGYGGGVYVYDGIAEMTGGTISKNTATNYGGGIYSTGGLTIGDGQIIDNHAGKGGGGIYVDSSHSDTTEINGGSIAGNEAGNNGGGIYNAGTLTLNNCTISKNTATFSGGGIYSTVGNLTISGGTISGNKAKDSDGNGGGIYFDYSSGTLAIRGTAEIDGNSATNGGGIYIASGTLNMTGGTIGTLAISDTAEIDGNSATNGAGVYVNSGTLNMTGGTISKNTATNYGGGIFSSGNLAISGGTISGNKAEGSTGSGGGIYFNYSSGTLAIRGTAEIDGNSATVGGGIYIASGTATMTGGTISNNTATTIGGGIYIASRGTATMTSGTISKNTATNAGGGIYIASSGTATMTDGTISNNTASTNGGGIYSSGNLAISGGTISGNKAEGSNGSGGGIYFNSSSSTLTISDKAEINGNSATNGGGIYIASGTLNMTGGTIGTLTISDKAEINGNSAKYGAGVYVNSGTMTMTGGTISGNTATNSGGGIHSIGNLTISGGTISGNKATSDGGGGIFSCSTLTISGGTISDNTATSRGGGICFSTSRSTLTITISGTAKINGNSATDGGGIYIYAGIATMTDGTISKNTATSDGGGVYIYDYCTAKMTGGTISDNTANNGGGICLNSTNSTLTISDTAEIGGNSATNGAGVYVNSGTMEMTGGTISNNTASTNGGGIYAKSDLTISGGTISENKAEGPKDSDGNGGGIYFDYSSGTLEISGTANIYGNSATFGGGICSYDKLTISGGTISNNTASSNYIGNPEGGGIYSRGNLTISGGTISNNTATYYTIKTNGGGIYIDSGTATMTGGTISKNTANKGGGIYSSGKLTISGGTISDNTAGDGGGIYFNHSGSTLTISGTAKIDGNSAQSGGGIYISSGTLNMTGGTIGTLTISDKAEINGNSAKYGAGVYVNSGTMTMTGGTISGNTATNSGGGIHSIGNLTISGGTISGNKAEGSNGSGGGIYFTSSYFTLTISGKAKIDGNSADSGAGIYVMSGIMTMTGGTISNNTATNNGGGIYNAGTLTISGGIISGNSIDIYTTKDFTLSGVGNDSKYIDGCVYLANNTKILRTNNADSVEQWFAAGSKIAIENAKSGYVVFDYTNSSNTSMVSDYGNVSIDNNGYELAVNGKTLILKATPYTITYNLKGGTGVEKSQTYNIETNLTLYGTPNRAGYTFGGWKVTTASGNWKKDATFTASQNVGTGKYGSPTLTAQWTPIQYTITYELNGGTGVEKSQTYNSDTNLKLYGTPTRAGYTFDGWKVTTESGNWKKDATFTASQNVGTGKYGNITLTAQWTPTQYKITYNLKDGTVEKANPTTYTIETATFTLNNPTRAGYTFTGWTGTGLSSATKQVTIAKGSTGDRTYTANWTINSYTLTANANGGTIPATTGWTVASGSKTATKSLNYGAQYGTLPTPNQYSKTGYTVKFKGWFTSASGGSPVSATTTMGASNTTIYAQWTETVISYTITYNANGGNAVASMTYTIETNTFTLATTTRTGYVFAGWKVTAKSGSAMANKVAVTVGNIISQIDKGSYADITVEAQWTANSYKISLDEAGGTGGVLSKTTYSTSESAQTFEVTTSSSKTGYVIDKYEIAITGGSGEVKQSGNTFTILAGTYGDIKLTIVWKARGDLEIKYFNKVGTSVAKIGNSDKLIKTYTYGQPLDLVDATCANYTFDGWYIKQGDNFVKVGNKLTAERTSTDAGITLYANWTYTIVFNTNAPAGTTVTGVANKGMNSGDSYAIAEKLTLNGYRFLGWKYGETTINVGDTVGDIKNATSKYHQISPTNSKVILTASWDKDEKTITVQYKVNGYTLNGKTIADYYGTSSNIDETPNVKPATGTIEWNSNQYIVKYKYAEKVQFNIVTEGMYNFTIKVDKVDVTQQVSNGTYTIDSLTENKSIVVEFTRKTFTVTITQIPPTDGLIYKLNNKYTPGVVRDKNNEVVADGKYTFVYGERLKYYFAVNSGYIIGALKDNDAPPVALKDDTYSIDQLTSNHNLVIEYTEQDTWLSYATNDKLTTGHAGTSTDPYIIDSAEKLAELAKLVFTGKKFSGKYFIVKTDISLAHPASDVSKSPYWFPIGINESIHFAGNFNGDGYTVSDMEVLNGTSIGLFGYSAGTIYNVKVSGSVTGSEIVGGVVGTNAGTVNYAENNATLIGKIGSSRTILGGVVGYNTSNGKIHAAANAGAIGGQFYYAGGIAGKNGGSIYNAYNSREITSSTSTQAFGGIVGYSTNGNIGYIYNYGKIANRDNKVAGQFVGQIEGTETVNIKGYYLNETSSATNSYDTGLDRSKTQMKPATTYIFNTTSIYAGWNLATNNQYLDNIWEIRANENDGYPVFKIQKNYKGEIVITSEYAKDAESFAMGFVKVTIGKKVYTFMLGKGKTYKLEGLEAGEYTVTTYASTNHTATAHRTNASGEVLGSVTLNETTTSVTIYIVIAKTGTGTFYGGAGIVGGSTSTNTTAMANEVEMVEYTEELDEKSEELESEVVQNNEETREEVETDTENDTQSNAEVVIPQPHFIATARIETKLNRVSKMEQISVKTKPSIPNSKTTMAENMAYMAEVKSTHIVPVHNKKTLV